MLTMTIQTQTAPEISQSTETLELEDLSSKPKKSFSRNAIMVAIKSFASVELELNLISSLESSSENSELTPIAPVGSIEPIAPLVTSETQESESLSVRPKQSSTNNALLRLVTLEACALELKVRNSVR
jgi:hypothetical protein